MAKTRFKAELDVEILDADTLAKCNVWMMPPKGKGHFCNRKAQVCVDLSDMCNRHFNTLLDRMCAIQADLNELIRLKT